MKAGVSTACLYPQLLEDSLSSLMQHKVKNTEIFINTHSELKSDFIQMLRSILSDSGASCTALHPFTCPAEPMMFFSMYERRVDDIIDYYKYFFEAMNKLDAKIFVFHGNKYLTPAPYEHYFERFARLAETAADFGVTAAQENVARCQSRSLDFMKAMAAYLGDKAKFVLDVKQAVRSDEDPFEIANALGNRIIHVHMSDHGDNGDCLAPGKGSFDIKGFLTLLRNKGFDGSVMLELYRNNFSDTQELAESCKYLDGIIDDIQKNI